MTLHAMRPLRVFVSGTVLCVVLALAVGGCGQPRASLGSGTPLAGTPLASTHVTMTPASATRIPTGPAQYATVEQVARIAGTTDGTGALAVVLVRVGPRPYTDEISVTVTRATAITARATPTGPERAASVGDLRPGATVQITFDGVLLQSAPAQGRAIAIVILGQ